MITIEELEKIGVLDTLEERAYGVSYVGQYSELSMFAWVEFFRHAADDCKLHPNPLPSGGTRWDVEVVFSNGYETPSSIHLRDGDQFVFELHHSGAILHMHKDELKIKES